MYGSLEPNLPINHVEATGIETVSRGALREGTINP